MTYYSEEAIKELAAGYVSVEKKFRKLQELYIVRTYKNKRAQEHAAQGFARRVKILKRCIDNVFTSIPPERAELPKRDELSDATINIQSFIFNVFGSIDNLAWIWMYERGQTRNDGTPIKKRQVGLGPDNLSVRATLSPDFQTYLIGLKDWFSYLTDLRHALAHRIPLYIPPYSILSKDEGTYLALEEKMIEATKKGDIAKYDELSIEQMKLGRFRPWIQHSFEEKSKPVVFHAQMLADFNTLDELGHKMIAELDLLQSS